MEQTQSGSDEQLSGVERPIKFLLDAWSNPWSSPWSKPGSKPVSLRILFGVLLASVCLTTFFIGAVPTFKYGHDNFFFLENGWRAIHGQRPQLDYWSPWGPVMSLVIGLGLKLANESPNAFGYANAIVALVIGLWAYRLGLNRLTSTARVLFAVYLAVLVCSPYPLGESPLMSSYAMLYNRYGYALLALVMLECVLPIRGARRSAEGYSGGVSTGIAMAVALFLKASVFGVSITFAVASLIFGRLSPKRLVGCLLGFGAVSLACMAYLRFEFAAVIDALHAAAGARAMSLFWKSPIWATEGQLPTLGLALALGVGASFLTRGARSWLDAARQPLTALLVFSVDIVMLTTNAQKSGMPLLAGLAIIVASQLSDSREHSSPTTLYRNLPFHACLLVVCAVLFLPQFAADALGLTAGALHKAHPSSQACPVRFDEPRLSDLILCDHPAALQKAANGSVYTTAVNDGAALLRQHAASTDKVLTMDMQNPFPYTLGWLPPEGGIASTSFNYILSAQYRPSFEAYFGDATVVMLPQHPAQTPEFIDGFYEIYLPAMLERYQLAAESDQWRLYRIK